ncbi:phage-related protein [Pseudomonas protegens]|uniref:type II toxin-antitoxin system RelE/ParE family toxin n=1 Tax=Pseudomonas TaxID=286 RepID=UPI000F48612B|nr:MULTISPECIES: type II toxin-antitoxin system RelE/ParE family toxin [Pseudomonas]MCS4261073.1 phage-related protein [Pseudomonas sp. BIGb0176]ROQ61364.1 phage-related protein [Pseudomonas protegens]ROQ83683.1 phage-related protein [Pseudomonas protegens]
MATRDSNTHDTPSKIREVRFYPDKAGKKEMQEVPVKVRNVFLTNLNLLMVGEEPACAFGTLSSLGHGIYELKINGSPAWRCIYYTGLPGQIVVLHTCKKTTNGVDRQLSNVVEKRLAALRSELKTG